MVAKTRRSLGFICFHFYNTPNKYHFTINIVIYEEKKERSKPMNSLAKIRKLF